jgi:hypothetical protein
VSSDDPAARLRQALDLSEFGERMQRQRLRRARPEATEAEIDGQVREWLLRRPGAEHGDHPGTRSRRFG